MLLHSEFGTCFTHRLLQPNDQEKLELSLIKAQLTIKIVINAHTTDLDGRAIVVKLGSPIVKEWIDDVTGKPHESDGVGCFLALENLLLFTYGFTRGMLRIQIVQ